MGVCFTSLLSLIYSSPPEEEAKDKAAAWFQKGQNLSRKLNSDKLSEPSSMEILAPRPSRIPISRKGQAQHLLKFQSCSNDSSLKVWKYSPSQMPSQSSLPDAFLHNMGHLVIF
uniref:Uncharacterized protein n=1 Tax=Sphaerodactylus townsendi TaxID=933632 RepID=A0ACB8G965_9SAUR